MKTQRERILKLLREKGNEGINSFEAREQLKIIQLPTRIFELKAQGYVIVERVNPNRSVNYILAKEIPSKDNYVWVFKNGYAKMVLKEDLESNQLAL